MSAQDTKDRIVRKLRGADEPALSAKSLAEELDVSVRTINNHIDHLVEEGRVATSQIGNATAYYIPFSDLPTHKKSDHICQRCGREVNERHDFCRVDYNLYFEHGGQDDATADFFIFCRFCYSDFISWVMDPAAMGEYPFVHSWEIPLDQLMEVRNDPEIKTTMGEPAGPDREKQMVLYEFVREMEDSDEYEDGVPEQEILAKGEAEGMIPMEADQMLKKLKRGGYVFQPVFGRYRTAK